MKPKNNVHEKRLSRKDFLRLSAGAASAIALSSLPRMTIAEQSVGSASEDVVRELLLGAVDTHIHGGPDVVPRIMSDLEIAREVKNAGYKAIILKSHVTPTAARATLVQQAVGGNTQIFGSYTLNKPEGGLNPAGVETELALGARQIWLPTFWSESHIKMTKRNLADAVMLFDDKGNIRPELLLIFELIAKKDVILGTGHATPSEIEKLVSLAKQRGVKKILITHPEWLLPDMSIDVQKRLVLQGVYFERCAQSLYPAPNRNIKPEIYVQQIRATGVECSTMASDAGAAFNPTPVEHMRHFIRTMLSFGITPEEIDVMVRQNPSALLEV